MAKELIAAESPQPGAAPAAKAKGAGFLGLDRVNSVVAVIAAMMGVWGAWANNERNQLQAELNALTQERTYAKDIYLQFDAIVRDKDLSPELRADRLTALMTLTALMADKPEAMKATKEKWIGLIDAQAQRYSAPILAKAETDPTAAAQVQRFATVSQSAQLILERTTWGSTAFDVFWCESSGPAAKELAEAIAALRDADPQATGAWRVRMLSRADEPRYVADAFAGNTIRYDTEAEKPVTEVLKRLIETKAPKAAGMAFGTRLVGTKTPNYISVFVCPGAT